MSDTSKVFISKNVEPYCWQSASSIREIFKRRFKEAGIEYYSPHCFRHLATILAMSYCKNGEEVKAVSQNFGHENVGTIMQTYGTLSTTRVSNIITKMNFTDKRKTQENETLTKILEMLYQQNASKF